VSKLVAVANERCVAQTTGQRLTSFQVAEYDVRDESDKIENGKIQRQVAEVNGLQGQDRSTHVPRAIIVNVACVDESDRIECAKLVAERVPDLISYVDLSVAQTTNQVNGDQSGQLLLLDQALQINPLNLDARLALVKLLVERGMLAQAAIEAMALDKLDKGNGNGTARALLDQIFKGFMCGECSEAD